MPFIEEPICRRQALTLGIAASGTLLVLAVFSAFVITVAETVPGLFVAGIGSPRPGFADTPFGLDMIIRISST